MKLRLMVSALVVTFFLQSGAQAQQVGGRGFGKPSVVAVSAVEEGPGPGVASPVLSAPCTGGCSDCCEPPCGPPGRVWFQAESLFWWINGSNAPPLVTTSPAGTSQAQAGVLGAPGTQVLFGNTDYFNNGFRFGGRFTAGAWLDCQQTWGVEAYYFTAAGANDNFNAGSSGDPILSRPFTDATTGLPQAELVAFPGVVAGSVSVAGSSSDLAGTGILFRENVCCGCNYRVDAIAGYRFLRLRDSVAITENLTSTDPLNPFGVPVGTNIVVRDRFATSNTFHGFDFGLTGEVRRDRFFLGWLAKVAIGRNFENIDIDGSTTVTVPGQAPVSNVGGLLALSSNIGHYNRGETQVLPEFNLKLGYQATPRLRGWIGYTFIYWPEVARASEQIDSTVNPNLIPPATAGGPLRPFPSLEQSSLWAQGIDLGIEFRF